MSFWYFTSESVTEGHPDKVADRISDTIVDEVLSRDKYARVACETLVTTDTVIVAGELHTTEDVLSDLDVAEAARTAIRHIGYTFPGEGFEAETVTVTDLMHEQSQDIRQGVDQGDSRASWMEDPNLLGAGDQGIMFGYATDETPELMPLPILTAHNLARGLSELRKAGTIPYLRPDGKTQVTVKYEDGRPAGVTQVLVSTQHTATHDGVELTMDRIKADLQEHLPAFVPEGLLEQAAWHVNPTGRFVIGGPDGDTGLTGRKIIIDTYGGSAPHGGGAFSGKDPSKVDRSATYAARWVAKNIVAAGLAKRCQVQVAYAIGIPQPFSTLVETFGTSTVDPDLISQAIEVVFDLRPACIIGDLDLLRPIYAETSAYGHFGRPGLPWESTSRARALRDAVGQ
jgi:S-adenosylmethionine synthetase